MGQVKEARAMRLNISEGERLSYGLIAPEKTTLLKGGFDFQVVTICHGFVVLVAFNVL